MKGVLNRVATAVYGVIEKVADVIVPRVFEVNEGEDVEEKREENEDLFLLEPGEYKRVYRNLHKVVRRMKGKVQIEELEEISNLLDTVVSEEDFADYVVNMRFLKDFAMNREDKNKEKEFLRYISTKKQNIRKEKDTKSDVSVDAKKIDKNAREQAGSGMQAVVEEQTSSAPIVDLSTESHLKYSQYDPDLEYVKYVPETGRWVYRRADHLDKRPYTDSVGVDPKRQKIGTFIGIPPGALPSRAYIRMKEQGFLKDERELDRDPYHAERTDRLSKILREQREREKQEREEREAAAKARVKAKYAETQYLKVNQEDAEKNNNGEKTGENKGMADLIEEIRREKAAKGDRLVKIKRSPEAQKVFDDLIQDAIKDTSKGLYEPRHYKDVVESHKAYVQNAPKEEELTQQREEINRTKNTECNRTLEQLGMPSSESTLDNMPSESTFKFSSGFGTGSMFGHKSAEEQFASAGLGSTSFASLGNTSTNMSSGIMGLGHSSDNSSGMFGTARAGSTDTSRNKVEPDNKEFSGTQSTQHEIGSNQGTPSIFSDFSSKAQQNSAERQDMANSFMQNPNSSAESTDNALNNSANRKRRIDQVEEIDQQNSSYYNSPLDAFQKKIRENQLDSTADKPASLPVQNNQSLFGQLQQSSNCPVNTQQPSSNLFGSSGNQTSTLFSNGFSGFTEKTTSLTQPASHTFSNPLSHSESADTRKEPEVQTSTYNLNTPRATDTSSMGNQFSTPQPEQTGNTHAPVQNPFSNLGQASPFGTMGMNTQGTATLFSNAPQQAPGQGFGQDPNNPNNFTGNSTASFNNQADNYVNPFAAKETVRKRSSFLFRK